MGPCPRAAGTVGALAAAAAGSPGQRAAATSLSGSAVWGAHMKGGRRGTGDGGYRGWRGKGGADKR